MTGTFLRTLPDGERFVLCRTGQKFTLVRRERIKNRMRIIVLEEATGRDGWLHHSCHVKPIVRFV